MLSPRASKLLHCYLCKENFVWLFHAKIKFCVFFHGTCVIIFSIVQLVQRKRLWRFYVSKQNSAAPFSQIKTKLSYLAIGKAPTDI